MMAKKRYPVITAVYLILVRDGMMLLSRRYNTGYEDGKYGLVAGHVEHGESVTAALIREAREEAGITLRPEHLIFVHVMHRKKASRSRISWFFKARQWEGEVRNCEPDKCDDLAWFPIWNLPENIIPYIHAAIEHDMSKTMFSEFGWT